MTRVQLPIRSIGALALAFALTTVAACNKPVSPADTSPGALDVKVSVLDTDAQQNTLAVVMQFFSGGSVAQFSGGETVTCNNVTLTFNGLVCGYAGRVPLLAPGGTYRFAYTRNGTQTAVDVTAPPRPAILTPPANATVARTTNLTIAYSAGGAAAVRGSASDGSTGLGGPGEQPDNGTYTGLDVSSLKAGPGSIGLTRILRFAQSGTAFKTAAVEYNVSADRPVTWT